MLGLGGPGLGLSTQTLALHRYKAKATADISEPHCHRTFLGNRHHYAPLMPVSIFRA